MSFLFFFVSANYNYRMFKLVALDLDGTLLNSNHELSERSINTLRSLSRSGVIVGIATGRSIKNILKYLVALDLPQDYVPTVLYNGAYGFKFVRQGIEWKPEELFGFPLPLTQTDAVLSFAAKYGCVAQVSNNCICHIIINSSFSLLSVL